MLKVVRFIKASQPGQRLYVLVGGPGSGAGFNGGGSPRGGGASDVRTVSSSAGLQSLEFRFVESLATQWATLELTERIHALFVESLVVQRETLERVRSLDRKTGGTAPGTPVTP